MHQKTAEEIKKERMLDNLLNDDMKEFLPYLEDDSVTDIAVVDSGEIIITQFGKGRTFTGIFVPDFIVERIIKATASLLGRPLESYTGFPILEGRIPKYNARITGLMQPNCIRPELQIRKPPKEIYSLENYVESGRMTQEQYDIIVQTIKDRKNIIVSGSPGSGKTTCTNAIIKKMDEYWSRCLNKPCMQHKSESDVLTYITLPDKQEYDINEMRRIIHSVDFDLHRASRLDINNLNQDLTYQIQKLDNEIKRQEKSTSSWINAYIHDTELKIKIIKQILIVVPIVAKIVDEEFDKWDKATKKAAWCLLDEED